MIKKILRNIKTLSSMMWKYIITLIKNNPEIVFSIVLALVSAFIYRKYQIYSDNATKIEQKRVEDMRIRKEYQAYAKQQHEAELECATIRELLKRKEPRMSIPRLEWKLKHAKTQHEKEDLQKAIECFKKKPGQLDDEMATNVRLKIKLDQQRNQNKR